ncbi:hypothetical protein ACIQLR_001729 [Photobacterium damselae]
MKPVDLDRAQILQKEMEELKLRLDKHKKILQSMLKQNESGELMSLIVESTATFERNKNR